MWKRMAVGVAAGAAWAVTSLDALDLLPQGYDDSMDRVVVGAACVATVRLLLWCQDRPVGKVYELGYDRGYEQGRRDQMRGANIAAPIPLRRRVDAERVDA